jgi:hypothetical protein
MMAGAPEAAEQVVRACLLLANYSDTSGHLSGYRRTPVRHADTCPGSDV